MISAEISSLYAAVTQSARFLFEGGSYAPAQRASLAGWILARQNRQNGFIFHPTQEEQQVGICLLSGEKPKTKLLANNALELETLRLLALLQPGAPEARRTFETANRRLARLCFAQVCTTGECAHASIAYLRYLTALDMQQCLPQAQHALDVIRQFRSGTGRWRAFPFFFTLLWLNDLPDGLAAAELEYARPYCETLLEKQLSEDKRIDSMRRRILQAVLNGPTHAACNEWNSRLVNEPGLAAP